MVKQKKSNLFGRANVDMVRMGYPANKLGARRELIWVATTVNIKHFCDHTFYCTVVIVFSMVLTIEEFKFRRGL